MTISSELRAFFEERFAEVSAHLQFLAELEIAARSGPPRVEGSSTIVTANQQKILYSVVYLQLYNLVEATVSQCVAALTTAAADGGQWKPEDLNSAMRSEWVRFSARTHTVMSYETRLESALEMCAHLIDHLPVQDFTVETGGGGNWDDQRIEKLTDRLGCAFKPSRKARTAAKKPMRDDMGALTLVKTRRNLLAHGGISFVQCADGVTVDDLRRLVEAVGIYLREALASFVDYIDELRFLRPESIPAGA
jgi:hypothetical protein